MDHFRSIPKFYNYLIITTLLCLPKNSLARKVEIHDKKILEDILNVKTENLNNVNKVSPKLPQKYPADFFPKELDSWQSFNPKENASEVVINLPTDFYKKHKNMEGPPSLVVFNSSTLAYDLLYPRKISSDGLSFRYDSPKAPFKIKAFYWEDETAPLFKKLKKTGDSPSQSIFEVQ